MLLVDTEQGRIIPDEEIKHSLADAAALRRVAGAEPDHARSAARAAARLRVRSRHHHHAAARFRLHRRRSAAADRAHGRQRRGADRFDGDRHAAGVPVGQAAAAVQLLQAAVRAGDQSGHRSDPRRTGDVADQLHRHRAQHPGRDAAALPHAEAAASDPDQPRSGEAAPRFDQRTARAPRLPMLFPRGEAAERAGARAGRSVPPGLAGDQVGLQPADSFGSRHGSESMRRFRACWR